MEGTDSFDDLGQRAQSFAGHRVVICEAGDIGRIDPGIDRQPALG